LPVKFFITLGGPRAHPTLSMNKSFLIGQRNQLEAEGRGLFVQAVLMAQVVLLFLFGKDALVISSARGDEVVDDAGQFVGRSGDGLRAAKASPHAAVVRAHKRLALFEMLAAA